MEGKFMTATIETTDETITENGHRKPRGSVYAGRILTGLAALFLTFDATVKILMMQPAIEANAGLGYPAGAIFWIGLVEIVCLAAYLIPRIAPLGAILWTGYLGGAIATHVRAGSPLFSHTLFPIYVAALIWAGLWLRDRRVRALLGRNS
jgi:hypothetical protein